MRGKISELINELVCEMGQDQKHNNKRYKTLRNNSSVIHLDKNTVFLMEINIDRAYDTGVFLSPENGGRGFVFRFVCVHYDSELCVRAFSTNRNRNMTSGEESGRNDVRRRVREESPADAITGVVFGFFPQP